jgi:hypothetical protein
MMILISILDMRDKSSKDGKRFFSFNNTQIYNTNQNNEIDIPYMDKNNMTSIQNNYHHILNNSYFSNSSVIIHDTNHNSNNSNKLQPPKTRTNHYSVDDNKKNLNLFISPSLTNRTSNENSSKTLVEVCRAPGIMSTLDSVVDSIDVINSNMITNINPNNPSTTMKRKHHSAHSDEIDAEKLMRIKEDLRINQDKLMKYESKIVQDQQVLYRDKNKMNTEKEKLDLRNKEFLNKLYLFNLETQKLKMEREIFDNDIKVVHGLNFINHSATNPVDIKISKINKYLHIANNNCSNFGENNHSNSHSGVNLQLNSNNNPQNLQNIDLLKKKELTASTINQGVLEEDLGISVFKGAKEVVMNGRYAAHIKNSGSLPKDRNNSNATGSLPGKMQKIASNRDLSSSSGKGKNNNIKVSKKSILLPNKETSPSDHIASLPINSPVKKERKVSATNNSQKYRTTSGEKAKTQLTIKISNIKEINPRTNSNQLSNYNTNNSLAGNNSHGSINVLNNTLIQQQSGLNGSSFISTTTQNNSNANLNNVFKRNNYTSQLHKPKSTTIEKCGESEKIPTYGTKHPTNPKILSQVKNMIPTKKMK